MLKALLLSFRCPHLVLPSFMVTCLKVFPSCYLLTSDSYWVFTEFCCSKEGPSHPPPIVHAYFYRVFHRVTPLCFRLLCWPLSFNEASTAVTELPGYRVFFFLLSHTWSPSVLVVVTTLAFFYTELYWVSSSSFRPRPCSFHVLCDLLPPLGRPPFTRTSIFLIAFSFSSKQKPSEADTNPNFLWLRTESISF